MAQLKTAMNNPKTPGTASVSCLLTWLGRRGDYSEAATPTNLTGFRRVFNSYTTQGKVNTVIATYVTVAVAAGLYFTMYKPKQRAAQTGTGATSPERCDVS